MAPLTGSIERIALIVTSDFEPTWTAVQGTPSWIIQYGSLDYRSHHVSLCESMQERRMNLKQFVRSVPNFPKPGIMFRDITPMLGSAAAMKEVTRQLAEPFRNAGVTQVLAAEARGFVFGVPLAMELGAGFVPVRKPGKLPFETHRFSYDLEYGSDSLEIHTDAVSSKDRVLLVDDLLATGGTIEACMKLAEQMKATVVGAAFVIELSFLNGRRRLNPYPVNSLIRYQTEEADE